MGFLSFSQVLLEQLLKFLLNSLPSLLTSPGDGQWYEEGGGYHLNFAIPQGVQKNFTHTVGDH